MTNLLGTQLDGRITDNGKTRQTTWDGIWKSDSVFEIDIYVLTNSGCIPSAKLVKKDEICCERVTKIL